MVRAILSLTGIMFVSVSLDPKSWALSESSVPKDVLCKKVQSKHVLSSAVLTEIVVIGNTPSHHVLCLNMAEVNNLVSDSRSYAPALVTKSG